MTTRKHDDDIEGLERVERAWRELGDEAPPGLVDQAVLNRARLAVERPKRAWGFNLTWVHGLATMGVAALALTLYMQMPGREAELPASRNFEVQLADEADSAPAKDTAGKEVVTRHRQVQPNAAFSVAPETPPAPDYDHSEPLAPSPQESLGASERRKAGEVDAVRQQPATEAAVAKLESADAPMLVEQRAAADSVATAARDEAKVVAEAEAPPVVYLRKDEPLTGDLLERPVMPKVKWAWPADPDAPFITTCRVPGDVDDPVARANADCETTSFASSYFEDMRRTRAAGDAARLERQRAEFIARFPDYPLPADLAE